MNKFYLTTAIPYVNAKPHIGHALEYFYADAVRRYYQIIGFETLLLSGADENALKNVQSAEKEGLPTEEFLDKYSDVFVQAYEKLGVHLDVFQRGSDKEKHWPGVQKLWKLAEKNGDIYKKEYEGLYCVGCESFKTEKELVNGKCPEHNKEPEKVKEENYFFKLSKYQNKLTEIIESNQLKIVPENKRKEALSFIKSGLEDFSISRSKERARGVGVPVPDDDSQVIYVWFDALNIYMTGIGYGYDHQKWEKWWPADLHIIGKDINRFHTVYWPAMLLSSNLPLPKEIYIHGFVTIGGEKISKSIGNVVDPFDVADKYGLEALRYFLLSQIPYDGDGSFTFEKFEEIYQANLANGLGNLVARVAGMIEKSHLEFEQKESALSNSVAQSIKNYELNKAFEDIWNKIAEADKYINENKVWGLSGKKQKEALSHLVDTIRQISTDLEPLLPETSEAIKKQYSEKKITTADPLFPRLQ